MTKKRILVFGLSGVIGGIENFYIEYYRKLDKNKYQIDFVAKDDKIVYADEILSNGGKIYYISKFKKHPLKHYKDIKKIYKETKYDVVHANLAYASNLLSIKFAKKYGVKKIIAHSHNTGMNHKGLTKIFHYINKHRIKKYATDLIACSNKAGYWMFGEKSNFKVVNNCVDINKLKFNEEYRKEIRNELSINEDCYAIGNIGRFCYQKNQEFIVKAFNAYLKDNNNSMLILIGSGKEKEKIINLINSLKIPDKVKIINTNEAWKYYNAFDIFVLPSFFEGLPVTGIEAQINGLPCIFSDRITNEVKVNNNVRFISIDSINDWVISLKKQNNKRIHRLNNKYKSYDINEQFKVLEKVYNK